MTLIKPNGLPKKTLSFAALVLCAACEDFPQEPELDVRIEPKTSWPDTMAVTDTSTVEVGVTNGNGRELIGATVEWSSDNPTILTVSQSPPARPTRADSLAAQLKAIVTAHRTGAAQIVATVVHPGLQRAVAKAQITVTRWPVAPQSSWPVAMTVTETTQVRLGIRNEDTVFANELRVQWQSSNEAVLGVMQAIPPQFASDSAVLATKLTATLIARVSDSATIVVTVERPGFEPTAFRQSIRVQALKIVPVDSLPDTLMVGDSAPLRVALINSRGDTLHGRQIQWQSTDSHILIVEARPTGAMVRAQARDSASVLVIVHPDGFERTEFRDSSRVMERWLSISAGALHTCAIAADSSAYCWGGGEHGALGNGRPVNSSIPVAVLTIGNLRFRSVSSGDENTCGIVVGDVAYCWGLGTLGRLGTGLQSDEFTPKPVSVGRTFESVSAGQTTCGLSDLSETFCWGSNSDLQLGTPLSGPEKCGAVDCSLTPVGVRSPFGDTLYASSVDVATFHTCAVSSRGPSSGWAYCWGSGTLDPSTLETIYLLGDAIFQSGTPVQVAPPSGTTQPLSFDSLSAGDKHTCGVTASGGVYCWGRNNRGQLGTNGTLNQTKPMAALTPVGIVFLSVSAGDSHTCALAKGGDAYCWGANDYGQLGTDPVSGADVLVPTRVLGGYKFRSLTSGDYHTCGITSNGPASGAVYCWGRNTAGQLGSSLPTATCTVAGITSPCSRVPRRVSEPID